jgi:hypothetical protein
MQDGLKLKNSCIQHLNGKRGHLHIDLRKVSFHESSSRVVSKVTLV